MEGTADLHMHTELLKKAFNLDNNVYLVCGLRKHNSGSSSGK